MNDRKFKGISVDGDRVTLDAALSDALDSQFTAASLVRYSFPGRITEVGVERLRIAAPVEGVPTTGPQYTVLRMDAVEDAWARDLEMLVQRPPGALNWCIGFGTPITVGGTPTGELNQPAVMTFSTRQE